MFQADCHPILIGSLPLDSHSEAVDLIMDHCPAIPLWPQLPKQNNEGMVRQFMTGFPGLVDEGNKSLVKSSAPGFETAMANFYEEYLSVTEDPSLLANSRFSLGFDSASGFFAFTDILKKKASSHLALKGQITGPVTTGIGINDEGGMPIIYNDSLRDMLIKHLGLKGLWQVMEFKKLRPDSLPIIFIDEPGLVSFGSTGFAGVTREMVADSVAEVIEIIQSGGALAGIHICANGDWEPALTSKADIISFDAYFYFDNFILYKNPLIDYLERGGIFAWGIVPTGDPKAVAEETTGSLYQRWKRQVATLHSFGLSKEVLFRQTLIAPSCGTGSLSPALATKVLQMTSALSGMARADLKKLTTT